MAGKYTSEQVVESRILASKSRYHGRKVIELVDRRNPLFIYHFICLLGVSLKIRLKFKDSYLKALKMCRSVNNTN